MKALTQTATQHIRGNAFLKSFLILAAISMAANLSTTAQEETLPDSGNYIDLAIGYLDLDGNEAAYLHRHGIKKHAFGGIEDFNYYVALENYWDFYASGHALYDNKDYELDLKWTNTEVGTFTVFYKDYRTWYDGSGNFLNANAQSIDLWDDELGIDRSELALKAEFTLPDMPVFWLSYRHLTREGLKGSTTRGATNFTGGLGQRYVSPALLDINEERDIIEAGIRANVEKTQLELSGRIETSNVDNARKMVRNPDEDAQRYVTQREGYDNDLFSARFSSITPIGEKTKVTTGIAYTELDALMNGSRIIGDDFDVVFDPTFQRQNRDHGFYDLLGQATVDQWVLNGNVLFLPKEHLKTIFALRIEDMSTDVDTEFVDTNYSSSRGASEEALAYLKESIRTDATGSIELIYTGQDAVVYNASLLYSSGDGELAEREYEDGQPVPIRLTNQDRSIWKAALGAKFYPSSDVNYFVQYYHKERGNDYHHPFDNSENEEGGNRYPAFFSSQDFEVDDFNARVTWRPAQGLQAVTRIDWQSSKIFTDGETLNRIEASHNETVILSEILSWASEKLYVQGSFNIVDSSLKTQNDDLPGVNPLLVPDFDNDYWNADLYAQWPLKDESEISIRAFYYRADNYLDNSAVTNPYGSDITEQGITLGWSKWIKENMRLSFKYTCYDSEDAASGFNNDYQAQTLVSSLRYRF